MVSAVVWGQFATSKQPVGCTDILCAEIAERIFTLKADFCNYTEMDDKFVNWENLDLDDLLGDYTDDGEFSAESEWSDSSDVDENCIDTLPNTDDNEKENDVPTKKRRAADKNKYCYVCPECSKEYKSASGFRGHVSKKHNKPELKGKLKTSFELRLEVGLCTCM